MIIEGREAEAFYLADDPETGGFKIVPPAEAEVVKVVFMDGQGGGQFFHPDDFQEMEKKLAKMGGFRPDQLRDALGRWADEGGPSSMSAKLHDFANSKSVAEALSKVARSSKVRGALSAGINAAIGAASGGGANNEITAGYIEEAINNIAVAANITKSDAKNLFIKGVDAIVNVRKGRIHKADDDDEGDEILAALLRIRKIAEQIEVEDEDEHEDEHDGNGLAKFDPGQPRDERGRWTDAISGGISADNPARVAWVAHPDNALKLPDVSPKPGDIALLREIPNDRAYAEVSQEFNPARHRLSSHDMERLKAYVKGEDKAINTYLRTGVSLGPDGKPLDSSIFERVGDVANTIDRTFNRTMKPVMLYRGLDISALERLKGVEQMIDRGYMSASTYKPLAMEFATGQEDPKAEGAKDGVLLKLMLPVGSRYSMPRETVKYNWGKDEVPPKGEQELVLPRNTVLEPVKYIERKHTTGTGKDARTTTVHEFIMRVKIPDKDAKIAEFDHNKLPVQKADDPRASGKMVIIGDFEVVRHREFPMEPEADPEEIDMLQKRIAVLAQNLDELEKSRR